MSLSIIMGNMFSGKTSELIRRLKRLKVTDKNIIVVNSAKDTRSPDEVLKTHDNVHFDCHKVHDLFSLIERPAFSDCGHRSDRWRDNSSQDWKICRVLSPWNKVSSSPVSMRIHSRESLENSSTVSHSHVMLRNCRHFVWCAVMEMWDHLRNEPYPI